MFLNLIDMLKSATQADSELEMYWKHNHLQTSQCREAQERRRNDYHMQRITGDVSWGSSERWRAHLLTRRTKHHDWFPPITRGQVLHYSTRNGLLLSHLRLSLPVCLRQGDRATHKKNPVISRRAGGGRIRTVGETEMDSDNPSTPTAACAQDYYISSESSFTKERRRSTAGGGSVSCY